MARYTCSVEQWDDETDVIRVFQAEVASYGDDRAGFDPDGWEVVGEIAELDEAGNQVAILSFPLGDGEEASPDVAYQRRLHHQVEGLLIADAKKQWDEEEEGFSDSDVPPHRRW